MRDEMPLLEERPEDSCPRIIVVEGRVKIWVGRTGPVCVLKEGEKVRFNKHGTFTVRRIWQRVADLDVKIPRKGWNPSGPRRYEGIRVPAQSEVTIFRGRMHIREIDEGTWRECWLQRSHIHPDFY